MFGFPHSMAAIQNFTYIEAMVPYKNTTLEVTQAPLTHYSVNYNCQGQGEHFVSNGVIQSLSFDEKKSKAFVYMLKTTVPGFPDPALGGEFCYTYDIFINNKLQHNTK